MCPLNGPWFTYLKTMIFHSYVELQSKDLSLYIWWSFICLLDVISTAVRNKQSKENEGYRWVHCAPNIRAGPKTFEWGEKVSEATKTQWLPWVVTSRMQDNGPWYHWYYVCPKRWIINIFFSSCSPFKCHLVVYHGIPHFQTHHDTPILMMHG